MNLSRDANIWGRTTWIDASNLGMVLLPLVLSGCERQWYLIDGQVSGSDTPVKESGSLFTRSLHMTLNVDLRNRV
ncbi:hypothetical protein BPOR_0468g00020 [Botrytis porri]|uniref:Lipoprotein n=1 Tax=Botrytis porri TaxID=87229 RepID=A0A4Z1KFE7_9HELO|nr:hypothetical protein BPOR_0468g00020 [Botrytis porri]